MRLVVIALAALALPAAAAYAQAEEGNNPQVRAPARPTQQPSVGRPASAAATPPSATTCADGTSSKLTINPCAGHGGAAKPKPPSQAGGVDSGSVAHAPATTNAQTTRDGTYIPPAQ